MKKSLLLSLKSACFLVIFPIQMLFAQTTVNFNEITGFDSFGNRDFGATYSNSGLTFTLTSNNGSSIRAKTGIGVSSSIALTDGNTTPNAVTQWSIKKSDNSAFQFRSIWLQEGCNCASTQGTVRAYNSSGVQIGSTVNVTFNSRDGGGVKDFAGNSDFYEVHEIRINATDIYLFIDNVEFGVPFVPVDTDPAQVTSISVQGTPGPFATSVTFAANFNKTALNVSTDDFQLTTTGTVSGTIASIAGTGASYTVTVNNLSGEGTLRLDLKSGTNITNANGNTGTSAFTSGSTHTLSACSVETFESGSLPDAATSFTSNGRTFNLGSGLEIELRTGFGAVSPGGSGNSHKYIINNNTAGIFTLSGSQDFTMSTLDLFLSDQSNGNNPTGVGSLTIRGKKDGVIQYTITKTSGFPTSTAVNGGFFTINFATSGTGNYRNVNIDQLEFTIADGFVELALDNFNFCLPAPDVDILAPKVISSIPDGTVFSNATSVNFEVVFDENALNVSADDFALGTTGTASGTISSVTGSGSIYTVTVSGITGEGSLKVNLSPSNNIRDALNNTPSPAFTSGQEHLVGSCFVETFEDETDGATSFNGNGRNFSLLGNWKINKEIPSTGIGSSKVNTVNTGTGPFSISSTDGLITVSRLALYLSSFASGTTPTNDGSVTIKGFKSDVEQFSVTKSTGFPTDFSQNSGYYFVDFSTEQGQDNTGKLIDKLEITLGGSFVYFNIENFEWCTDVTPPSGYSVTIDQDLINLDNQNATSFTFAGAEIGTTYNYTFSSSGGGTNVTGSGTVSVANQQITGIDLSGLADGTITLSVTLTDEFSNIGTAAEDTSTKLLNSAPVATPPATPVVNEDDVAVALSDDIQITDNEGDNQVVTFTVVGGTVTLGTTGITFGGGLNGSSNFTASGTLANINTALDAATFTPTPNLFGTNAGSISFVSNDGTVNSNTASVTFNIIGVNDDPAISGLPPSITVEEDAVDDPFDISAATITDVDAGSGELTLKLIATGGIFDIAAGTGVTIVGQLSSTLTLTGNLTNLNNYIDVPTNIYFRPDANLSGNGAASVSISINDNGNSGSGGGTDVSIGSVSVNVTPVNDAPTDIQLDNTSVPENEPIGTLVGSFSATDPDSGDTFTFTLVPGVGSEDNASFSISGNELRTAQVFDFDVKNSYSVRIRVTDSGSLTFEKSFTISVEELNEPPTDLLLDNNTVAENATIGTAVGTFSTVDPNSGDSFTYAFAPGVGDEDNGSFSIAGDELQTGAVFDFETKNSYSVRIRVTDSGGLFLELPFNISVTNVNELPVVLNSISNQNATEDAAFSFQFALNTFQDIDGDVLSYTAQLSGGGALPSWLSFNSSTRTFSGTPGNSDVGTISIAVTANDGNGGTVTDTFDLVVANTNDAPTVANPIPDQSATQNLAFNFQFGVNTFSDIDVGDVLTYSAQLAGGGALPAWLTFDPATRTFSGTPSNDDIGSVSIDVTANDGNGGTVTDTFLITVNNVNDGPIVLNPIPNQNATEDAVFSFQFALNTFQDIDGDVLSYTAQLSGGGALPAWLSFNPATRTFSGTPGNSDVGTISIAVTANDGNGGTVTDTFDIAVANTNDAPTVANPIPDQSATEDVAFNFQFAINTFNDIDVGDVLTYSAQLTGGGALPAWLSFDAATRTFSGTPGNADSGLLEIEVIAEDQSALSVSDIFELTVNGVNDAPIVSAPLTLQVFEDVEEALTGVSFTDPDAGSSPVEVTFAVPTGTLSAVSGSGVTVSGTPAALVLEGVISDINDFISAGNLTFTTALNSTTDVSLNIIISDNGNTGSGGVLSDQTTVTIQVTAVNDAPVNSVPGNQQTDQDVSLVFSSGNGNLISVSDVDAGGAIIKISSTVTNGVFSLSTTSGLVFTTGSGVNNASMAFEGTIAAINTALSGMVYTPTPGFNGLATLTIVSDDQGFSGSGVALTDTDEVAIRVNSINPIVTSVTSNSANGFYKVGDQIDFQVIFDQAVVVNTTGGSPTLSLETGGTDREATYLNGSGTIIQNFTYVVQEGDFSSDLDYTGINALVLNGAVIENATNDPAILELPALGSANSLSGQKNLIIDGVIPSIASVSVPSNGIYALGQNLDFTVNFTEAVVVNGTPQISLTVGSTTRQANYLSGSGSNALVFRYTVLNGDLDLNGIVAGTLSLNGATVRDAVGNNANLTLNGIESTSQVLVDGVPPTVASLSLDNTSLAIGQTSTLTLVFSERVTGLGLDDFIVENGMLFNLSSSDGGITWTAILNPENSIQDDTNRITLSNSGLTDLAGNAGTGTTESNNYEIDTRRPTATVTVTEAQLAAGETTLVTITFSEAITGLNLDDFIVANGSLSDLGSSDGGIIWTATLTPDPNVQAPNNVIQLDNTGYQDLAGNSGTGTSVSNNYSIDTNRPTGYSVSIIADRINGVNQNNFSFNLVGGEVGSDYSFSISSSGGGTPITGTGDVTISNQLIDGIDVSTLLDGILTLTVTLTDDSGNEGAEVSDTVDKLLPAVLTINVIDQADENGAINGSFEVVTDNQFASNTTVTIEVEGTATNGSDYSTVGSSFVFPANTTSFIITISVIDDVDVEGDETVSTRLVSTDNSLVTIGDPNQATLTIADNDVPRQLTITPDANQQKVYGSAEPVTYSYSASGFDFGDDESIIQGSLSRQAGENTGTYSFALGNLDAGPNYELVLNPEVFTITPATLTIEVDQLEKVYGAEDPEYTYAATGFKLNDTEGILQGTLGRNGGENVGSYQFNLGTLSAGPNYNLQLISNTPFQILPAPLTITADDKQKTFGQANPDLTFTYEGLVNGDTQIQTGPTLVTTATATSPAGDYAITVNGGSDPNYSISRIDGTLTIGQKTVTITADNQNKVYGQANPVLTFSYTGLLEGDTQIQTEPSISTTATANSNVGSYPITLTGGSDPNYAFTLVNGTLSVTPASLTITADDQVKVYGEANPALTFTYSGLVNGDTQVTTEPSISTTATQGSNVGTYPITLSGGSDPNYAITLINGILTIGQKAVTITADDKSKVYGEANPALTFTYSGLVNGDLQVATEPTISTTATQGSIVGTYPINLSGGSDPNYAITLINGTLTIGQKAVTITADDKQKTFGEANPVLTFTYSGLVNGDLQVGTEPSISTTASQGSNVGTYPITLTGGSDPNYAITLVNGTLTIGQKVVTITANDKSKVYGEANPALTFTYSGLVNGDTQVAVEPGITTATASSNVGTYPITLTGASDPNYTIMLVNGTLTIGQKTLTITADDESKVYGEANPALTFTYSGLVNGDAQVAVEPSISTTATASSNVGTYPITLSGASDPNYAITLVNGTLTIDQKALTITADDKSKVYGEANPALTFTYSGLVNGDTQVTTEPSISTTATASSNVGTYPITLSGASDPNYAITLVNGTLTIGQKALTITADDKSKVYGEANPALTFTYSGLVNGDTQVTTEPSISTTATTSSNVGTYPITLSGASDPNYAITLVNGTLTIGQKAVTITADDKQKTYGETNPALTFTYSGLVNGDTKVTTEPSISSTATASSNVGTYPIILTGGSDQNYAITLVNGTLTIGQKTLTITADDKSKVYGEANPALTFTYSGLVNGDTKVTTEPSISTTATASSNVGTYPIILTGGSDQNYAITLVNATLTIGQKTLIITADDKSKVYGETNPALTFTYNGLVNGDTKVASEPSISTTATQGSNVGTYPITLTGATDPNYAITLENGTLTIGQKALTITADDKQKTYGEANPALTFNYSGLVNGNTKVTTEPSISTSATAGSNVGTYPITLTGGFDANYSITLVNGTLTVNPAILAIDADSKTKIFGNPDPALTFTASGFKLSDTEAILTGSLARTPGETVGIYTISQGTLDAVANYAIAFQGSEFEIIPAELAEILTGDAVSTPWSVDPVLPSQVSVLTKDGQILSYGVTWDKSTLNLLRRGNYTIFGTVNLPTGVLNPTGQKAVLQVIVLPKPAPSSIDLSTNSFIPDPSVFFQDIGYFTVNDDFDDVHTVELVPGAADNGYFEIKSDILFWSSSEEAAGRTQFSILVRVTDRDGNVIEKSFTILRARKNVSDIEIFNSFTPNGDGINDTWGVPDLKYFSGARVQVFDRSGQRVFYTESPAVRWDGTFEGKELPVGSYYWILESRETGEVRRGILNLIRQ